MPRRKSKLTHPEPTKFLPKNPRNAGKRAAPAAPATAAPAEPPAPQNHLRIKKKTIELTISNGSHGIDLLFPKKPVNPEFTGWGKIIEDECAKAFFRHARNDMNDSVI